MDLNDFITNLPTTTRERNSEVREALDSGKLYISLINKNNKKHFKIYFMQGDVVKTKQLKTSENAKKYILENKNIVVFSNSAKQYLGL